MSSLGRIGVPPLGDSYLLVAELLDVLADPVGNLPLLDPGVEGVGDLPALNPSLPGDIRPVEKFLRAETEFVTGARDRIETATLIFPTLRQVEFLPKDSNSPKIESRLLP